MSKQPHPFTISYLGASIEVIPEVKGLAMEYIVRLPTREVRIEFGADEEESWWEEIPGGKTLLAQELGAEIEKNDA